MEVTATATLSSNGTFCMNGRVDLFEGTSTSTSDLDGWRPSSGCVGSGGNLRFTGRVNNTAEGGDYADIDMTFTNAH